jgi:hypothetical protein
MEAATVSESVGKYYFVTDTNATGNQLLHAAKLATGSGLDI